MVGTSVDIKLSVHIRAVYNNVAISINLNILKLNIIKFIFNIIDRIVSYCNYKLFK